MSDKPIFYIGHHEKNRRYAISDEILDHARDLGYDMLTTTVTSAAYQPRVLSQLSSHIRAVEERAADRAVQAQALPFPVLEPLMAGEVNVAPNDTVPQLLLTASSWVDLASPDPLLADISRQVLFQEVSYAAFCGASNIIVEGPRFKSAEGITRFARAIQQALTLGVYISIQIRLPACYDASLEHHPEVGDLDNPDYVNQRHTSTVEKTIHQLDSWDAWNIIRTVCDYSSRLSVALILNPQLPQLHVQNRWASEPLRIIDLPGRSFVKNKHSIHVLPRIHQDVIARYMRLRNTPWILLSDVGQLPDVDPDGTPSTTEGHSAMAGGNSALFTSSVLAQDPLPSQASKVTKSKHQEQKTAQPYIEYIRQHVQTKQPSKTPIERFGHGYQDYLQNPLQPLTDNLESITYEVFEKDPIKYEWYERAVEGALQDWITRSKPISAPNGSITVAVVGAGRGPLVARTLAASERTGIKVNLWALEKNPSAFVLLQRRNKTEWNNVVHLVQSDMRQWLGPDASELNTQVDKLSLTSEETHTSVRYQKQLSIDILVSELLGSFGDNELSPECLDGVQRLLTPAHGLSIPSSYSAHLTPIAHPKLHADIKARTLGGDPDAAMIPYVVMLQAFDFLSMDQPTHPRQGQAEDIAQIRQAWEFHHPIPPTSLRLPYSDANSHNRRFAQLSFPCRHRGVCHGLAGYFETVLYRSDTVDDDGALDTNSVDSQAYDVELSTNPINMDLKSKDMISWFPIYFPFKIPIYYPDDSELVVSIWRQTDGRKVWYEWMMEVFLTLQFPQADKRVRLGSTDLHTSVKNACLI